MRVVYLEKPMTFTIKEGQELVKTVRSTNRVMGIGSQQRSDPNFQHAIKLAQGGALGQLEKVNAHVGAPPTPYLLPEDAEGAATALLHYKYREPYSL